MTPYTVTYSFAGWQAINPAKPLPATPLDVELANIATSVDSLIGGLAQIRRSDGAVQNGVVTFDSLDDQMQAAIAGTTDKVLVPDIDPAAFATQVEAEGGVSNDKLMTPLRTAQAVAVQRPLAAQAQAQAGADNTVVMTPLRTAEALAALRPLASQAQAEAGTDNATVLTPLRAAQQIAATRTAFSAVAELTYGAITAGASAVQSVSVPGAAVGDGVVIGLPAAGLTAGLIPTAWVSATGAITLRITNTTAGSLTPAVASYRLTAIRF